MVKHVYLSQTLQERVGDVMNPEGSEGVITFHVTALAPPGDGEFGYMYGALAAGRVIGEELQLQWIPSPGPILSNYDAAIFSMPLNSLIPATFVWPGQGTGTTLLFRHPEAIDADLDGVIDLEGDAPFTNQLKYNQPIPAVALLRWTGAYWLVVTATEGVTVGPRPHHA